METPEMFNLVKLGWDPMDLSILNWQDIYRGIGRDYKGASCALCYVYGCEMCPIYLRDPIYYNCELTPYQLYVQHKTKDKALEELRFLCEIKEWAKRVFKKGGYDVC